MLRLTVLALLLANALFFAWSQGALLGLGLGPSSPSEPQRASQQILPEALRIDSAEEGRSAERLQGAAPRPADCLLAGPFDAIAGQAVREALQSWPAGAWRLEPAGEPARWIVYMGRYASAQDATRKQSQLRQLGIAFEAVADPALAPGLSLGSFDSQAAASQRLERLGERGLRTARVLQESPAAGAQLLRLPLVDDALRARLDELRPVLAAHALRPCRQS